MVRWTSAEYEAFQRKHKHCITQPMPEPKPGKRVKQSSKPLMNALETAFYHHLTMRFNPDFIKCQAIRFRLGNGIWFKPDMIVFLTHSVHAYEVKGPHAFRGGFENLKVAAGLYPSMGWHLVWRDNGQWKEQHILP